MALTFDFSISFSNSQRHWNTWKRKTLLYPAFCVEHVFCGIVTGVPREPARATARAPAPVPLPLEVTGAAPIHPLEFVSIHWEVC